MKPSRLCFAGLLATVAALVGCDHATKLAAETALRDHAPVSVVPGVLDLAYTENRDVAFDAFTRLALHPTSWLLVGFGIVATTALLGAWVHRRRAGWATHAGFAMLIAGALGNVLDRAARGHVIDFIHVRHWPVFNVADVLVVVGGVLLFGAHRRERGSTGESVDDRRY